MSQKLYEESNIQAIANAIRQKNNVQDQYTPSQMPNAILAIHPEPNLETLSVSQNGNYLPSSGKDGFSSVSVTVPNTFAVSDEGKVVKNGALAAQTSRNISANGTYDTTENDSVIVDVSDGGASGLDNVLFGSSVPDASIGTPGDTYIQVSTNSVDGHAYNFIIAVFYKSSQNVWERAPDPALPYPRMSLRIVSHSTGGNDASIDIYVNQTLTANILYSSVSGNKAHAFDDIRNLFIGYSITSSLAPDHVSRSGWCVYTPSNNYAVYNGETINPNSLIQAWSYDTSVDFTFEV